MKKRLFSILLALVTLIGLLPTTAFSEDAGSDTMNQSQENEEYGDFIDGEQVISDMIEKHGMYAHPRIIMSEEKFAKLRTHIGDDSVTAIVLENLRKESDKAVRDPVQEYEIPDGMRLLESSRRIQRRVMDLAMAYNVFGDEKYAQRCYEELESASKFPDWNQWHFLDVAEMSVAFAIGYDWLYDWMNEEQRNLIKTALIEKGLNMGMEDYLNKTYYKSTKDNIDCRSYCWYKDSPGCNWKSVCNGGLSIGALALGDEADVRDIATEILTYAYKDSYNYIRYAYSEKDGSFSEGLGYWDYATYFLGMYSSSLASATGTDYGLADYEGLRKSADFMRYMSSNTSEAFGFGNHDEVNTKDQRYPVLLWLGEYFQSYDISAMRIESLKTGSFRCLDLLWLDEEKMAISSENIPTDWGNVGGANASFRNTWDLSGLVSAFHVGENNYKYTWHYDLGSFYVESNGKRFFGDLGNEWYELPNRQYSYRIRAEGHNTLVINPSAELDQQDNIECLISNFSGGNEAYAVSDLSDAYEPSGAESVVRGLKMIKDKECVIVQDEISLTSFGEIYWFAHTKAEIDVADNGRSAILSLGSEKLWVGIISEDGTFTVMNAEALPTSPVVPNQSDNSAFRKLAVHLTNIKDTTISVACIPLKEGETQPNWIPMPTSISEWTNQPPEGDVNGDGEFNIADIVALQKWLLAVDDVELANWKSADLCNDDRLDVFDLCLMKEKLIKEMSSR